MSEDTPNRFYKKSIQGKKGNVFKRLDDLEAERKKNGVKDITNVVQNIVQTLGATVGGADTNVQYNDGGVQAGDANFTWDKTQYMMTMGAEAGQALIFGKSAATADTVGATMLIGGGTGNGTGDGGDFTCGAGTGGATGNGGKAALIGGNSGADSGNGGEVEIRGGTAENTASGGDGGRVFIIGGTAQVLGTGGNVDIEGGDSQISGDGGSITLTPGTGADGGANGIIEIHGNVVIDIVDGNTPNILGISSGSNVIPSLFLDAGIGDVADDDGGMLRAKGGDANGGSSAGYGGLASFEGGSGVGSGDGGGAVLAGGLAGVTGRGGTVQVYGAPGGLTSGNGGEVQINGGAAQTSGNGGSVNITPGAGAGAGADGKVIIDGELTVDSITELNVLVPTGYAEMYMYGNVTACVINTANVYHAILNTFGNNDGTLAPQLDATHFTYKAGVSYAIAAFANYNAPTSTQTKVTITAGHLLLAGEPITITGTTNYNGTYVVLAAGLSGTEFVITKTYVANDATGSARRPATLKCLVAGKYMAGFTFSGIAANNNDVIKWELNKDAIPLDNIGARAIWTSGASNYRSVASTGLVSLTAGQYLWASVKNYSGANNVTFYSGNVWINRLK